MRRRAPDVLASGFAPGRDGRLLVAMVSVLLGCGASPPAGRTRPPLTVYGDAWRVSYRLTRSSTTSPQAQLEAWATVTNGTAAAWHDVALTLVSGAPGDSADQDRDRVPNRDDLCPFDAEDRDGHDDGDGCPDPDNDQDRVLDDNDRCPNEPETYNGADDDDGCPDHARIEVTHAEPASEEVVFFAAASSRVATVSRPVLDAVASALIANPSLTLIEVGGHTSHDERDEWALSAQRAAAVRAYLIARGVEATRLAISPYGKAVPRDPTRTAMARRRNRRVELIVLENELTRPSPSLPAIMAPRPPRAVAEDPVTYIAEHGATAAVGESVRVPLVRQTVEVRDALELRPGDKDAGHSDHPSRVLRLTNATARALLPGPLELQEAKGRVVLELPRIPPNGTGSIDRGLDRSTKITTTVSVEQRPWRIVAARDGLLDVEDERRQITTYGIDAQTALPLALHHPTTRGHTPVELPPIARAVGEEIIVELITAAERHAEVKIVERAPVSRWFRLDEIDAPALLAYLDHSELPADAVRALRDAAAALADIARFEGELVPLRQGLARLAGGSVAPGAGTTARDAEIAARARDVGALVLRARAARTRLEDARRKLPVVPLAR